ncbi:transposase [Solimonas aquatica]|uniref:transposase n=1 Tax=Solimonas aquatica TaxID=489703 RepID=UPI000B80CD90|nr:transposase [Solimonas aquatica]
MSGKVRCSKLSRKNAAREREPWLIAASPSLSDRAALDLIKLYRVRMRIEHSFRTLKSHQFGFSFEDSQSRHPERIAALRIVHALALFLAWIAGWAAQRVGLYHQLKSNANNRQRKILSIVSLGCLALSLLRMTLTTRHFVTALAAPLAPPPLQSDGRI